MESQAQGPVHEHDAPSLPEAEELGTKQSHHTMQAMKEKVPWKRLAGIYNC